MSACHDPDGVPQGINVMPFVEVLLVLLLTTLPAACLAVEETRLMALSQQAQAVKSDVRVARLLVERDGVKLSGATLTDKALDAALEKATSARGGVGAIEIVSPPSTAFERVIRVVERAKTHGLKVRINATEEVPDGHR